MNAEFLRNTAALLASTGVFLQVLALSLHWDNLSTRARRVSVAACGVLAPVAAGCWYAVSNHFPPSPILPYLAVGLLLFDLAVLYRLPSGR